MVRLTATEWRNLTPWGCCGLGNYCRRWCYEGGCYVNGCVVPKLYHRLARYEDTGLEPEEIRAVSSELVGEAPARGAELADIAINLLTKYANAGKEMTP